MGVKDTANLALIPAAYKASKVYSALPTDGDGDFTFTRTGSGTRINKAGLIETMATNVPRLNYRLDTDGNPSSCPELLLEPTRRNLFLNSEDFTNIIWIKTRTTITGNQTTAPDGTQRADLLTGTGTGTSYIYDGVTLNNGVTYTISIFVKPILNISSFAINIFGGVGTAYFNLVDKTVNSTTGDFTSAKIEDYGNGWLRCSGTLTLSSATGSKNIGYGLFDFNGDQFYIWGAQVEDNALGGSASYISSYIPTAGSAVTRNKDEAKLTPFVDMANDYPVTVYAKARVDAVGNPVFGLNNTSSQNYYLFFSFDNSTQIRIARGTLSANDFDNYNFSYSIGDIIKVAVVFISATAYKLYVNGTEIANLSSGTSIPFNHDDITIGQLRITNDTGTRNSADELFLWNKALTDAEMVEVTSYTSFTEMATQQQYTIQ